jgi:hypothetical protein
MLTGGRHWRVIDPKGIESRTYFDDAGRTLKTIEHYVDGVLGDDNDTTTEYADNAAGMTTLTARPDDGGGECESAGYGDARCPGADRRSHGDSVRRPGEYRKLRFVCPYRD